MKNPSTLLRSLISAVLATAVVAIAPQAMAAQIAVLVLDDNGRPVPDAVITVQPTTPWAPSAQPPAVTVKQKDLRFEPAIVAVQLGTVLRLTNEDNYDHHVRSQPSGPLGSVAPAKNFEFRIAGVSRGKVSRADVLLDVPGAILLGCHLHGSMRGHVFVSPTPWVALTDSQGRALIDGIPEGAVDLRVWHPEQLTEQTGQRLILGKAPQKAELRLNFRPSVRRVQPSPSGYSAYGS